MAAEITKLPSSPSSTAGVTQAVAPPHSEEAEQLLLGAVLFNNELMGEIEEIISPEHFYSEFHARIFRTIQQLLEKGWAATPITVRDTFRDEGQTSATDLLTWLSSTLNNATLGAPSVREWAQTIRTAATRRQMMVIGRDLGQTALVAATADDTTNAIAKAEGELFQLATTGHKADAHVFSDVMMSLKGQIEVLKNRAHHVLGVSSGFYDLDDRLGGFEKSDLVILAARPSMGKTALALNIAANAARAKSNGEQSGAAIAVFSLEMSTEQLASRVLSGETHLSAHKFMRGYIDDSDLQRLTQTANEISSWPIFIDDTPQLSVSTLRARARRLKRRHDIGLIIVDYLQLMRGSGRGGENRVQEISEISQGLKLIARELEVPVIALSQLSRAVEGRDDKRPQLSDLRESGSIEQDADVVMFLYRQEYYERGKYFNALEQKKTKLKFIEEDPSIASDSKPAMRAAIDQEFQKATEEYSKIKNVAQLIIGKNRKGPTDTISLHFSPETTTFSNAEHQRR